MSDVDDSVDFDAEDISDDEEDNNVVGMMKNNHVGVAINIHGAVDYESLHCPP